jgi:hypothetical protein
MQNRNQSDGAGRTTSSHDVSSAITPDFLNYPHEDSRSLSCPLEAPLGSPLDSSQKEQPDDVVLVCTDTKLDDTLSVLPVTQDKDALEIIKGVVESTEDDRKLLEFSFEYKEKFYEQLVSLSERLEKVLVQEAKEWVKAKGPSEQVLARVVELRQQIFSEVEEIARLIPNKFISAVPYARFSKAKALLDEAAWLTPKLAEPLRAEAKKLLHFMPTGFNFKDAIITSEKKISNLKLAKGVLFVIGFSPSIVDYIEAKSDEEKINAFRKFGEETGEALTGAALGLLVDFELASGPVGWVVLGVEVASAQIVADHLGDKIGKAYLGPAAEKIARYFMRVPKPDREVKRP